MTESSGLVAQGLGDLKAAVAENVGDVGSTLRGLKDAATDNAGKVADAVTSLRALARLDAEMARLIDGIDVLARSLARAMTAAVRLDRGHFAVGPTAK